MLHYRGLRRKEFLDMCDYSLHSVRTRPAKVGEKLVTHNFGTGTRGFAAPEDTSVAIARAIFTKAQPYMRSTALTNSHELQLRSHRISILPRCFTTNTQNRHRRPTATAAQSQ